MSEDRARELIAKGDKKLTSMFSMFSSSNKYEDAEELYKKAANQLKVSKSWDEAGAAFEKAAQCHLKLQSPHEAATAYREAAGCYRKVNAKQAIVLYKEVVSIHIDLGRFTSAAKEQKEIGELLEAEGNLTDAIAEFTTAADYYQAEEQHSSANQVLLKVAGLCAASQDYKRAVEIYEQVAIASMETALLKFSVKNYLWLAGVCRLATGEIGAALDALERYDSLDPTFASTMEGKFLRSISAAYEELDEDAFTDTVREYDAIARLDSQKTTLLLEIKTKIKASQEDIT